MTKRLRNAIAGRGFCAPIVLGCLALAPGIATAQNTGQSTTTTTSTTTVVNAALSAAKSKVTQAQAEQSQAKVRASQGETALAKALTEAAKADAALKDSQGKLDKANQEVEAKKKLLATLNSIPAPPAPTTPNPAGISAMDIQRFAADYARWQQQHAEWEAAKTAAQKMVDDATKAVSDAEFAKLKAQEQVKTAEKNADVKQGEYNILQKDQQDADAKAQQAVQELLNQAQLTPAAASKTTQVAAATPNLLLLASALTPMTIGSTGTLIGQKYSEGPISVPCMAGPCPVRIPHARSTSGCGCFVDVPVAGSLLPAIGPDYGSSIVPATAWPGVPISQPARGHHPHERPSTPEFVPAVDSGPPTLSGPMPIRDRSAVPTRRVRQASFQVEEAQDTISPPAAETIAPPVPMAPATDPNLGRPVLPLPDTPETHRQLRYFGAIAAPNDQARSGSGSVTRREQTSRDPFSFEPQVTVVPVPSSQPSSDAASGQRDLESHIDSSREQLVARQNESLRTYHFDLPARFPVTRFGNDCCAFEDEGAIIHEGMRFLARQDGQYEVRFNITAPSIPVVVRLQLVLYEKDGHVPRTLTLPPVVLKPTSLDAFPDDLEAGVDPTSYIVTVLGYSQVVREVHQPDNGTFLLVKRIGTARFGSGVRQQATP